MPDLNVRAQDLTVYLLKESIATVDDALRDVHQAGLRRFTIPSPSGASTIGELVVKQPKSHVPRWADWFEGYVDPGQLGRVSSTAAALIVRTRQRLFALTFGAGRSLLTPDCWEERFGLRVTVNAVKPDKLRSVDKRTFDALSTQSRVQASREGSAPDFGLDVEQDLVRAVTGVPADENLGLRLTGADSLHATARVLVKDIKPLLRGFLDRHDDVSYKKTFPWIDHIAEVTDKSTVASLDEALVKNINGNRQNCWLCVPDIVDWSHTAGFRYAFRANSPFYPDLRFDDFLGSLEDPTSLDLATLKRRRAHRVNNEGQSLQDWAIYRCIYCEIDLAGQPYILSTGKWYRVDQDFVASVNHFFAGLPVFAPPLPEFNDASEGAYCTRVANEHPNDFALMDRKVIKIGGVHDSVEFCDLLSANRDIIHIKRYGASSVLSHLFSQALVSGEIFCSESTFRQAALDLLPDVFKLFTANDPLNTHEYRYVFAIISEKAGPLTLPFFSRVNLRHAARLLQAFGYQIALAKIQVADALAKKRTYAPH
jgi:uncharacterized protein (TIGR04141 family)